jgi:ABC-type bacteriocin/lantibiotic exporter with double-glycine peptidase domain
VGCSFSAARKPAPSTAQAQHLQVPFFPDRTDQCGPSALQSVLTYWGHAVDPATLKDEVYIAHLKGSLSMDLLLAAQKAGLKAELYEGNLTNLKAEVRAGHPLIAFLNRGTRLLPLGHYVVVTGFDDARQGVYVHSGTQRDAFMSYGKFERMWNLTDRSTLLVLPPEQEKVSPHAGT